MHQVKGKIKEVGGKLHLGPPKSAKARRTIPLPGDLLPILRGRSVANPGSLVRRRVRGLCAWGRSAVFFAEAGIKGRVRPMFPAQFQSGISKKHIPCR